MNHRSSEDAEGHMNTGIEWPVYAYVGHEAPAWVAEYEALRADYLKQGEEVERLKRLLLEWGWHDKFCPRWNGWCEGVCTCGWVAVRATLG